LLKGGTKKKKIATKGIFRFGKRTTPEKKRERGKKEETKRPAGVIGKTSHQKELLQGNKLLEEGGE